MEVIITASIYDKRNKSIFFLSDLSKSAVKSATKNLNLQKISSTIKEGDCFVPWKGKKFDIIINDISGVSKKSQIFHLGSKISHQINLITVTFY